MICDKKLQHIEPMCLSKIRQGAKLLNKRIISRTNKACDIYVYLNMCGIIFSHAKLVFYLKKQKDGTLTESIHMGR